VGRVRREKARGGREEVDVIVSIEGKTQTRLSLYKTVFNII
jgi:hypothetical protein